VFNKYSQSVQWIFNKILIFLLCVISGFVNNPLKRKPYVTRID